jgi:adenylyltransferase/sulfurtransferase
MNAADRSVGEQLNAADVTHGRYARQIVLKEIGEAGQRRIADAVAVVAGLGALGSHVAELLARAGVGTLRLVDRDLVELSNLQRQCLFSEDDAAASLPKADAAARRLRAVNSAIRYEPIVADINPATVERFTEGATVVVDGLDNFYTRMLINEACVKRAVPFVYGACLATYGSAVTVIPGVSACLHCLFPGVAREAAPPVTCETVGVLGPVAALVAAWQASEALKIASGHAALASPHLIHVDLWRNELTPLPAARVPGCTVCGGRQFDLLAEPARLATASLCGRNAVQVVPPRSFNLDFDLLATTLARTLHVERNPHLLRFRAGHHEMAVFRDGRAIVFGTSDANEALSLYGKFVGN